MHSEDCTANRWSPLPEPGLPSKRGEHHHARAETPECLSGSVSRTLFLCSFLRGFTYLTHWSADFKALLHRRVRCVRPVFPPILHSLLPWA
jgi:hypothetical protein